MIVTSSLLFNALTWSHVVHVLGFPLLWAQFVHLQASEYISCLLCAVCVLGCPPLWALLVHSQTSECTLAHNLMDVWL